VSITRPAELAKELFTHKGSGTLVRRGERVHTYTSWSQIDRERLRGLIESSFGRTLAQDYFERTRLHRVYVSENYRAAIILADEAPGIYLDKFAVLEDAQGEGLGRAVWQVMREENPRVFWRSRHNNPVNEFYFNESDGCYRINGWKLFWYGFAEFGEIADCVKHCRERPATLLEAPAIAAAAAA
jgi:acetylglutamate kinase